MFEIVLEQGWFNIYLDGEFVEGFDNPRDAHIYTEWLVTREY